MTHALSLDNILRDLADTAAPSTKTASEASPAPDAAEAEMLATVQALSNKTAAAAPEVPAGDAVGALRKIASETAAAEGVMLTKTAELAGAAMCDGFMARLAGYDAALGEKTASTHGAPGTYTEEHLKLAYDKGVEDMKKHAEAEFAKGQEEAFAEIHKTAAECHLAGQQSARYVLLALGAQG